VDLSLMVKTLLRPHCLRELLKSIRTRYPDIPVIVADDSPEPTPEIGREYGATYEVFEHDAGPGACYNWMVDRIETPYTVLLDDDFVFGRKTRLENFLPHLEAVDLVGGAIWHVKKGAFQDFVGYITPEGLDRNRIEAPGLHRVHVTMNFFAAKTDVLRAVRWDEDLKVCRHEDFFLRFNGFVPGGEKVEGYHAGYSPDVVVNHRPRPRREEGGHRYADYRRKRYPEYAGMFKAKWGFEKGFKL